MYTQIVYDAEQAARYILDSQVVGFPTETVYGLGANVFDEKAVKKIYRLKNRPEDNPLIVHVSSKKQIYLLSSEINPTAYEIIKQYFPGPVTVILKRNLIIPDAVTTGLDTIAVRMPDSKIAREFIKACGVPIAAPSANLSGSPSPTSFIHVLQDFSGKIPCILAGPSSKYGLESTVIDCSTAVPAILRPGIITLEQLRKIDRRIKLKTNPHIIKSPGLKYKHYTPAAKVILVNTFNRVSKGSACIGLKILNREIKHSVTIYKECRNVFDYARNLFSFFRLCDDCGIRTIYAQKVEESGIGLAVMNRLKKAAAE